MSGPVTYSGLPGTACRLREEKSTSEAAVVGPDTRNLEEPKKGGDDRRDHAGIEAVFRGHAGNGGKGDSLGQGDDRPGCSSGQVHPESLAGNLRPPAQKRKQPLLAITVAGCGRADEGLHG